VSEICQPKRGCNIRIRTILSGVLALVVALAFGGYLFLRNLDLDDYKDDIAASCDISSLVPPARYVWAVAITVDEVPTVR